METSVTDASGVTRHVSASEFQLADGEFVVARAGLGFPPSMWLVAIVVAFIPPIFIVWSGLLIGGMYLTRGSQELLQTDRRLLYKRKTLWGRHFTTEIENVNIEAVTARSGTDLLDWLDRMFGAGKVTVRLHGQVVPAISVADVRKPGLFAKAATGQLAARA